ncbi:uncharacterized protein LOC132698458 [Cylas formicarius]|uniref:uncharacterized protein LOC132698458 n=1 Tax=Cylas formicarius TaxID=197179 RepID=UPI0029587F78|nr:uncharacterized protein LOC132698458 [Cylas formicarius]
MVHENQIMLTLGALLALSWNASAFWFGTEEPKPSSPRVLYSPPSYYQNYAPPPLPYIPMQVPLPAAMAPAALPPATVQNVQLVPCLCPVTQEIREYSYEGQVVDANRKMRQFAQSIGEYGQNPASTVVATQQKR